MIRSRYNATLLTEFPILDQADNGHDSTAPNLALAGQSYKELRFAAYSTRFTH